MRDILRKRGVYVRKGRGVLIPDTLFAVVRGETTWPDDEDFASNTAAKTLQIKVKEITGIKSQYNEFVTEETSGRSDDVTKEVCERVWYGSITNLSKTYYTDSNRYNGLPTDNSGRKQSLFEELCGQASTTENLKGRAFSIMLTYYARHYYFDSLRGKQLSFLELDEAVIQRLVTAEQKTALVRDWDSLT